MFGFIHKRLLDSLFISRILHAGDVHWKFFVRHLDRGMGRRRGERKGHSTSGNITTASIMKPCGLYAVLCFSASRMSFFVGSSGKALQRSTSSEEAPIKTTGEKSLSGCFYAALPYGVVVVVSKVSTGVLFACRTALI